MKDKTPIYCYQCRDFLTAGRGMEGICAIDGENCTCTMLCVHQKSKKSQEIDPERENLR